MANSSSAKYNDVDEYIASQPPLQKKHLKELRKVIKKSATGAEEVISYGMPAFRFHSILVYFAGFKNHYSLFPASMTVFMKFEDRLKNYVTSKGTIQFPLGKPMPVKLISEIVKFRMKENLEKQILKENKKRLQKNN